MSVMCSTQLVSHMCENKGHLGLWRRNTCLSQYFHRCFIFSLSRRRKICVLCNFKKNLL